MTGLERSRPSSGAAAHRIAPRLAALVARESVARLAVSGFVLVVAIFAAVRLLDIYPWNDKIFDLWAYWSTGTGIDYTSARPGDSGAYIYSPAFAHLIAPLTALPLPVFTAAWTVLLAAAFYWLTGWRAFFIGVLAPVTMSIAIGQLDILMAAAIVLGFRWPAAWALAIITKLTPGIGLLWYAARGEWRALGVALGATLGVVAISMLIDPAAWLGWMDMLLRFQIPTREAGVFLPIPVLVRLPLVALLIVWGARTNRRWVLPVAICFSLPTVWLNTPTILVALLPLTRWGADTPAGRWLRAPALDVGVALWRLPGLARVPRVPRVPRRLRRAGLVLRREVAGILAAGPATRT